jgi:two-component system chemotaxis sensor kinase CheA
MSKTADKLIPVLRKFLEDLETYSLNDHDAWRGLAEEVRSARRAAPGGMKPLRRVLEAASQALESIAAKTLDDYLGMMDGLAGAFEAAAAYLENRPEREARLAEALEALEGLMSRKPAGAPEAAPAPAGDVPTLDDLAAQLMLLEQEAGGAEAETLRQGIAGRRDAPGTDPEVRRLLHEAAGLLEGAGNGSGEKPLAAVGRLLEQAMQACEASLRPGAAPTTARPDVRPAGTPAPPAAAADAPPEALLPPSAADGQDYMPAEPDVELIGEFVEEGSDLIAKAEEALLRLETDPEDTEAVGTVFRAFHTVKGTSAFLDLSIIAEMGHHAESLLSRVRDREIRYSGGYADLSLRALDMLKELVRRVQGALGGGALFKPAGYDELLAVLKDPEAAGISEAVEEGGAPRLGDILVAQGRVSREEVEAAAAAPRLGDILVAQGGAERQEVESALQEGDGPSGVRMVRAQAASAQDVGRALRTQQRLKAGAAAVDTSVRVSTDRLDRLIDMVGELVIAHSMVAQDDRVLNGNHHELIKKIGHTTKIVRELQDISMSLRMVPLKATFNKMTRLVRDLARKLGKKVELVTEGEETEIDRNLVDIINDPLVHMVRNAVDHGIELPEPRRAAGKPEAGTIKLAAYHSAGNVVVEITDDGKGLDRDVILAKAVQNGLVHDGAQLTDREIFNLIFEPGFSTASVVTDVSGRGVGMDVVRKNIESLRGTTEIYSRKGQGSTFKMSLPLTLAIIDGMVVRVAGESYVLPTVSIVKSIKPEAGDIATVLGRGEMISIQGKLIPLVRLSEIYGLEAREHHDRGLLVVIVEDDRSQAGLIIDELLGRQQVVIKSLGESMRHIPGISGSAIMPNGRVGLILDVGSLLRLATEASHDNPGRERRRSEQPVEAAAA